ENRGDKRSAAIRCRRGGGRRGGGREPPRSPPRGASSRPARSARRAAEAPSQPPVAGAEDEADQRPQRPAGKAEARLPADAVGDQAAAAGRGLERALVFPDPLAQHRGALEEPPARLEADQGQVVVVERDEAEEEHPAAADPRPEL